MYFVQRKFVVKDKMNGKKINLEDRKSIYHQIMIGHKTIIYYY